jgi:hypothetical protein
MLVIYGKLLLCNVIEWIKSKSAKCSSRILLRERIDLGQNLWSYNSLRDILMKMRYQ